MSTASRVRHLLGVIAHARVNHHPVQAVTERLMDEPTPAAQSSQPADAAAAQGDAAWDPHEVWVNRVKKPREQRSA